MYNIDIIAKIYYNCVSLQALYDGTVQYSYFPRNEFRRLARVYLNQYSETEISELRDYIKESVEMEGHPYAGMRNRRGENVFALLEQISEELLTEEDDTVLCQYRNIMRYREVTSEIEEDMLICAYLAMRCVRYGQKQSDFLWTTAIGHNNMQLNRIMERKISDNHFHLYGSAPAYQLIWIHLMNNVCSDDFYVLFKEINKDPRKTRTHYSYDYSEDDARIMVLKAALLRVHIVAYLLNEINDDGPFLSDFVINNIITDNRIVEDYVVDIQKCIDYLKSYVFVKSYEEIDDYAIVGAGEVSYKGDNVNTTFSGERWLMYSMFVRELKMFESSDILSQWFYIYLAIKSRFRGEMVQCNDNIGFENFQIYSRRKGRYNKHEQLIKSAIGGTLESGNVQSLEVRITPGKTAKENMLKICYIEDVLQVNGYDYNKIYYVFHFTKEYDEKLPEIIEFDEHKYRHFYKRGKIRVEVNAIRDFRMWYPEQALRVCGIDACSQEIGCRPEVFAMAFRFLANDVQEHTLIEQKVGQLKLTYHVGEDFLDVIDGLRAVDEAVRFLSLQCGDRIGHGTVLGIDVKGWYRSKDQTIFVSQQDYLDNVVWFHQKLIEFKVHDTDILREYLLKQFDLYFSKIYLEAVDYGNMGGHFTISDYYEAWKLRGDAPELYESGKFDDSFIYENMDYMIGSQSELFSIRNRKEITGLYYLYQYNWNVRHEGGKVIEIYVPSLYIDGVIKIQKEMQRFISERGIGIETNPSSNLSISTFGSYDEHPIVQMYNKDLTWDVDKLKECAQMNVSINTDDKGIFHTSLENEYALMACSLEHAKDESGQHIYNRQMIYQWLDNIREMGNMQRFKK